MQFGAKKSQLVIQVSPASLSDAEKEKGWFEKNQTAVSAIVSIAIAAIGFFSAVMVVNIQLGAEDARRDLEQATDIDTSAMLLQKALQEFDHHFKAFDDGMYKSQASATFDGRGLTEEYLLSLDAAQNTARLHVQGAIGHIATNTSNLRSAMLLAIDRADKALAHWTNLRFRLKWIKENSSDRLFSLQTKYILGQREIANIVISRAFCAVSDINAQYQSIYTQERNQKFNSWGVEIEPLICKEKSPYWNDRELDIEIEQSETVREMLIIVEKLGGEKSGAE
nr:hypothetical protein [uncultured Dongia sp.]